MSASNEVHLTTIRTLDDYMNGKNPVIFDHRAASPLIGTERQTNWAEKVRAKLLADLNQTLMMHLDRLHAENTPAAAQKAIDDFQPVIAHLLAATDAGWWLDRRHLGSMDLLRDAVASQKEADADPGR